MKPHVRFARTLLMLALILPSISCTLQPSSWMIALSSAFSYTTNEGLGAQQTSGENTTKTRGIRDVAPDGITISWVGPVTGTPLTYKLNLEASNEDENVWDDKEGVLPDPDDPSDTGTWKIVLPVETTVTATLDNYSREGWTFDGSLSESFDAIIEYQLDIPGEHDEPFTSMVKSSVTTITINGDLDISGDRSGRLVIEDMQFIVEQYEDNPAVCFYEDEYEGTYANVGTVGTAFFGTEDVTEDIITLFEEEIEFF